MIKQINNKITRSTKSTSVRDVDYKPAFVRSKRKVKTSKNNDSNYHRKDCIDENTKHFPCAKIYTNFVIHA